VIDEAAADLLSRRLQDRRALDLLVDADGPPPQIEGDATLVEVASVMVWLHVPLVAVVEDDRLLGAISIDELLSRLLGRG
jgi:CBS domain-containing protein